MIFTHSDQPGGRIAYVCADPGVPVFGKKGCSVHVQEIVRAFSGIGAEVELFAARFDGMAPPGMQHLLLHALPRVRQATWAEREEFALQANGHLRNALERSTGNADYDLVYERYSLWSYAGMEFARERGIPGVLEVNAPLIEEQKQHRALLNEQAAFNAAERAFRAATRLIAVSEEVAAYLESFPGARGKVSVVPNGVDPERFRQEKLTPALPRSGSFTVGFVGTLKPWHGLSILADAFGLFFSGNPGARLLIVGEGPERIRLAQRLADAGALAGAVFTGSVPPDRVPGFMASMDIGVAPYPDSADFYFSPLKVYEYMAAGLPVVASRVGQLERLIEHRVNGWLVTPGDPSQLAAAFRILMDEEALRAGLGLAGRELVLEHYTWQAAAKRILELAGYAAAGVAA
jgi:glycosyltransferase involved in cell wall biosynthesis